MKGRGRVGEEIPEKVRRPAASSGTIPTCQNPEKWPGREIEPGSPCSERGWRSGKQATGLVLGRNWFRIPSRTFLISVFHGFSEITPEECWELGKTDTRLQLVVPEVLQDLDYTAARVQFGVNKTLDSVILRFYWLHCRENVEEYLLVAQDYFTKKCELIPYRNQEARIVAYLLVENVLSWFGVPLELYFHQRRNFVATVFQDIRKNLGMKKTMNAALHPKSDGMDEILNHALEELLASHLGDLGSIPGWIAPGFPLVGIALGDTAGRRVFTGISRFPRSGRSRTFLTGKTGIDYSRKLGFPDIFLDAVGNGKIGVEIWMVLNIEFLRADEGEMRSPRKPTDQRHRPTRFLNVKIRKLNPVRFGGRR
ncbi:hypothetical protein PR048_010098, partial [Dryococelus australis]